MWYDAFKTHRAQLVIATVASLAAGAGAGYTVAIRKLDHKYAEIAEVEIADAKRFYTTLAEKAVAAKKASPGELVALLHPESSDSPLLSDAADALLEYQTAATDPVVKTNVFIGNDYVEVAVETGEGDGEEAEVDKTKPYIITEEVWQDGEPGYNQITLSFYSGDWVLADEEEKPIDNVDVVIGIDTLNKFGEGCDDPNTVFVRNDVLKMDFEVVRSDGKYIHEVLGLQHSDDQRQHGRPRKFRNQDE